MPYKKKPRWLKWVDRYESLFVLAILALDLVLTVFLVMSR